MCWHRRVLVWGNNGLEEEQHSRGFLVGGGSVRPRYGLFSVSSLRLYFCLPPRTRSRRTPVLQKAQETQCEGFISPWLDLKGYQMHELHKKQRSAFKSQHFLSQIKAGASGTFSYICLIKGQQNGVCARTCVCVRMRLPSMCGCVSATAAFPYVVNSWLVYCDTAEPRAGLNIWIINAGSVISKTGPLII